jgi:hypothetical protein
VREVALVSYLAEFAGNWLDLTSPGRIHEHGVTVPRERVRSATVDRLIVSDVIRRNEQQAWFVPGHVVNVPLSHAT